MTQDWANDNAGSIELTGHLVAVGQRRLAIQNQIQQIAALQSLAEVQRRQQMENALLEERQNILYDISASLDHIKRLLDREPARAYYEFLVLEEFVSSLGLEHRMFRSLEWKNHCNKTLAGINELDLWCKTSLDSESRKAATAALRQRKLEAMLREDAEVQKRKKAQEAQEDAQRLAAKEAISDEVRGRSVGALLLVLMGLAVVLASKYGRNLANPEISDVVAGMMLLFGGCILLAGISLGILTWFKKRSVRRL